MEGFVAAVVVSSLILLAKVDGHAEVVPREVLYWKSTLSNTPMPKAITDMLFTSRFNDEKTSTDVGVGKGGVVVNTNKPGKGSTSVTVNHGGVGVVTGRVGHKPVIVSVKPGANPFNYMYAATETQLHDDPKVAFFLLEKDLRPGSTMQLGFPETKPISSFITKAEANTIPFSSEELPAILKRFSVQPGSPEAKTLKNTLQECEEPTVRGERKLCATSLESMVEFATSSFGTRDVDTVSTEVMTSTANVAPQQKYTVAAARPKGKAKVVVAACHAQDYVYAVFLCHATRTSRAYEVELVGQDGTKVTAAAVCHLDTAAWNPRHVAFKVLNVTPGSVPVCHFLPQDHLFWIPRSN